MSAIADIVAAAGLPDFICLQVGAHIRGTPHTHAQQRRI